MLYRYYLLILVMCFGCLAEGANTVALDSEEPIMLYADAYNPEVTYVIHQDFSSDFYADVELLDTAPFRFKAKVTLNMTCGETVEIYGWLDKVNCVVFLRADTYQNEQSYIYIYKEPSEKSDYQAVEVLVNSDIGYVIGYAGYWYHVVTEKDGKLYEGWTKRCCTNILNSCN